VNDRLLLLQTIFIGMQGLAGCCGFPILIISILVAIQQSRLGTKGTRANVYNSINMEMMEIDRYFVEHPDLKPYFYECKDVAETDPIYPRVASMAEWMIDFMDNVLVLSRSMPEFPWKDSWFKYFEDLFNNSVVMCRFWRQRETWYAGAMRKYYPREFWDILNRAGNNDNQAAPAKDEGIKGRGGRNKKVREAGSKKA
jgi:hypothetical protein